MPLSSGIGYELFVGNPVPRELYYVMEEILAWAWFHNLEPLADFTWSKYCEGGGDLVSGGDLHLRLMFHKIWLRVQRVGQPSGEGSSPHIHGQIAQVIDRLYALTMTCAGLATSDEYAVAEANVNGLAQQMLKLRGAQAVALLRHLLNLGPNATFSKEALARIDRKIIDKYKKVRMRRSLRRKR